MTLTTILWRPGGRYIPLHAQVDGLPPTADTDEEVTAQLRRAIPGCGAIVAVAISRSSREAVLLTQVGV